MNLNEADIALMSTLLSAMLGTIIVPYVVALVVHSSWSTRAKRLTAVAVSFLVGGLQFWLEQVWTGKTPTGSLAVMVPIIFAMSQLTYVRYWKPILGPIEELDLIGKLIGKEKP